MDYRLDARVPVVFGTMAEAGPADAVLLEGDAAPGGRAAACFQARMPHAAGCACCAQRRAAGLALTALLQARARGTVAFFTRVVAIAASEAGREDILAALAQDPVAASCFRLQPAANIADGPSSAAVSLARSD
jgi:hypothetical protein